MILKQHYWPSWQLCASGRSCKHNVDILSPYKVVIANLLANSCIFTHPADTQEQSQPFFWPLDDDDVCPVMGLFFFCTFRKGYWMLNASLTSLSPPLSACRVVLLLYQSCLLHVGRMVVMVVILNPYSWVAGLSHPNKTSTKTQSRGKLQSRATILWFHHNKRHLSHYCWLMSAAISSHTHPQVQMKSNKPFRYGQKEYPHT